VVSFTGLVFMLFRNFEWLLLVTFGWVEELELIALVPLGGAYYSVIIDLAQVR
jgi:hypothetical protein